MNPTCESFSIREFFREWNNTFGAIAASLAFMLFLPKEDGEPTPMFLVLVVARIFAVLATIFFLVWISYVLVLLANLLPGVQFGPTWCTLPWWIVSVFLLVTPVAIHFLQLVPEYVGRIFFK
ncbi:MAG: hypothetical protein FGM57_02960 [Candidatus Taylorbacteria bacterium]|nr:hypothetical protein [Candidatus Taylorbacteria bacterium]